MGHNIVTARLRNIGLFISFLLLHSVKVKDVSPDTEARLMLDLFEGKIIDFWKTEAGYEVIKVESFIKGSKVNML